MPAGYMFHDVPAHTERELLDPIDVTLAQMDRFGISTGLVSLSVNTEVTETALTRHPGRFAASFTVDPNQGMKGVDRLVKAYERWGVRAASSSFRTARHHKSPSTLLSPMSITPSVSSSEYPCS